MSNRANLGSFDNRQRSSDELPKDRGIELLHDVPLRCPDISSRSANVSANLERCRCGFEA